MPCRWLKSSAAQTSAIDELHHDVGQRAELGLGLAGVVDGDDGGVVERGRVLRLAPEPLLELGVAGEIGTQHLDRDVSGQTNVAALVDL
jgi:hypothetical protein